MIFHKTLLDFIHYNEAVTALNKAHIRIYKGKPESQIIVLDLVKSLFAFVRIVLGNRNLAL